MTVVNTQRYNGRAFDADSEEELRLYNPLTIGDKREPNRVCGEEFSFRALGE